jgi:hypothetical protein
MDVIFTHWSIVAGLTILAVVLLALWFIAKKRRQSHRLQQRFGAEYDRTVNALGSQKKAECDLRAREKRVGRLTLTSLGRVETARISQAWSALQARFVDNPRGVVIQAGQLVRELMQKRGYSTGDFERHAADVSVDHPTIVASYRLAQAIAVRDESDGVDTEELRQAVVLYRALIDELLKVKEATHGVAPTGPLATQA